MTVIQAHKILTLRRPMSVLMDASTKAALYPAPAAWSRHLPCPTYSRESVLNTPLRVQSIQIWNIYGLCTRNRKDGFGDILCVWVFGPLGLMYSVSKSCTNVTIVLCSLRTCPRLAICTRASLGPEHQFRENTPIHSPRWEFPKSGALLWTPKW